MNKIVLLLAFFFIVGIFCGMGLASAETLATVCCEKTKTGASCQDVPSSACEVGSRQVPTACSSTSFCKPGTCYDSNEGICLDNTPQSTCNSNGGIWSQTSPPQCSLGCCILGDQASFVSLVRCKRLSSLLGLQTNYDNTIKDELTCVAKVQQQDRGACVYESEFEKTCKFTTRSECSTIGAGNGTGKKGTFYKDKLCSAEELGTTCGPSTKTTCLPGKDEVYFVDTCGNPANIYDSSKTADKDYWTNVKGKSQSCNPSGSNAKSASCGNCNYLLGGYCRSSDVVGKNPTYGSAICGDLSCTDESGNKRRHGESWCANDEKSGKGANTVGSRFFRRVCMSGTVITEPCDDFRAQECVEDSIETPLGKFSQAACRVNRWQDCIAQTDQADCGNTDKRDCLWKPGITFGNSNVGGTCVPKNTPGLNFWTGEESKTVCGAGNRVCVVKYEKGFFGGEKCVENCDCLTDKWKQDSGAICAALGDCGSKTNYIGKIGFKQGVTVSVN